MQEWTLLLQCAESTCENRKKNSQQQQQLDRKNERRKDTIKGQERSASERETAKGKQAGGKQETSTKVTVDHVKHLRAANKGAASPFPLARSTEASRLACVSVLEQRSGDARKGGHTLGWQTAWVGTSCGALRMSGHACRCGLRPIRGASYCCYYYHTAWLRDQRKPESSARYNLRI